MPPKGLSCWISRLYVQVPSLLMDTGPVDTPFCYIITYPLRIQRRAIDVSKVAGLSKLLNPTAVSCKT